MALTYVLKDEIAVGVGSPTIRPGIINEINSPHTEENLCEFENRRRVMKAVCFATPFEAMQVGSSDEDCFLTAQVAEFAYDMRSCTFREIFRSKLD